MVFTDLDDSLFHSHRRLKELDLTAESLPVASVKTDGSAVCFQTPQQGMFFELLANASLVIPVTGRSSESLARVLQPTFESYRVVSHGAVIRCPSGEVMSGWRELIDAERLRWADRLKSMYRELCHLRDSTEVERSDPGERLRVQLVSDEEVLVYVSVKGPEERLAQLRRRLRDRWSGGRIHHNRRDLALLPSYASKSRAVAYLIERLSEEYQMPLLTVGLGDSLSDLSFLKLCDFAITPRQSAIQESFSLIGEPS